jgi:hypothetical protein
MKKNTLWLIGTGNMAISYVKVLKALDCNFTVIGRGKNSAFLFEKKTGINPEIGGVHNILKKKKAPNLAIVAVSVENLAKVTRSLISAGTKYILLEKPGGLNLAELSALNLFVKKNNAEVLIAYNRRFYNSVEQLKEGMSEDGGLLSINFDFTEPSFKINDLKRNLKIKKYWLLANSSHVIDLAFYLAGKPKKWKNWIKGKLPWGHPARFCGSGITKKGILFSYISDWQSPGRWGIELMTAKRRFILRPMEKLQVMKLDSFSTNYIRSKNKLDMIFKPGLFLQTKSFLNKDKRQFCSLSEQIENTKIYNEIAGY